MERQDSYRKARERLEEIVVQVRAKDLPLEKSLDLYEEALRLGALCAEHIDTLDFDFDDDQEAAAVAGEAAEAGEAVASEAAAEPEDATESEDAGAVDAAESAAEDAAAVDGEVDD